MARVLRLVAWVLLTACAPRAASVPTIAPEPGFFPPPPPPLRRVSDPSWLSFSIQAVDDPRAHEPALRLTWRNVTWDESVWLKYFVKLELRGFFADVWLDVEGSSERKKIACSHCSIGGAAASSYVLLLPQAEVSLVVPILCSPLLPGHYRVVAHYRDENANGSALPLLSARHAWFTGELVSNAAELDVHE